MTAPAATPALIRSEVASSLNHIFCCDPGLALCGADVSEDEVVDLEDADCIVCLDLEDQPCPTCGE